MPPVESLAPSLQRYGDWGHSGGEEHRASQGSAFASTTGAKPTGEPQVPIQEQFARFLLGSLDQGMAGVPVTQSTVIGVSTVYACVDLLARSVATLPLNLYRRTEGGGREQAREHPLFSLLHDEPNSETDSASFRRAMEANLALHNDAYAIVTRNSMDDQVISLTPVEWSDVRMERDRVTGDIMYVIRGTTFAAREVLHLHGMGFNGLQGLDLVGNLSGVFGLAVALDRNASTFFKNQSFPGGFLESPNKLSQEAADRLVGSFQDGLSGSNGYKIKVLEEGLQYHAARIGNRDSQFDESRDRQAKEVARVFGIPGHKVGIVDNQPRANVEQENLSFLTDTLRPILVTWEQAMNRRLLTTAERREFFFEFNLAGLLRGSQKDRYDSYKVGREWGWLSVNEIRRMENMNPIGERGDVYLQPLNMAEAGVPGANNEPTE